MMQTYMYAFSLDLPVAVALLGLNQARSCRRYTSRPLQASVEIASELVLTNNALDVLCCAAAQDSFLYYVANNYQEVLQSDPVAPY
ncbi:hypothetical protein BDV39DRAFT_167981 [Aspergillus sergii]|uniref:Uncharacterized protein n=1 Tax=Aspergillus sergii TaxID=1034303 RepID=A0A5N6XKB2_9EURO|nr:hypothetical protein BDV39DRAFT_167981 [Aspergillus sergii]